MWLTYALRLAYPGAKLSGIFFYDDGTAPPGNHLKLDGTRWVWDGTSEPPAAKSTSVAQTVVIEYDTPSRAVIAGNLPDILAPSPEAQLLYNPRALIHDGPANPRARRRYLPCPSWWWTLSPGAPGREGN
jgi:hypothetical protein